MSVSTSRPATPSPSTGGLLLGVSGFLQKGREEFEPLLEALGPEWVDRRSPLPDHDRGWFALVNTDPRQWPDRMLASVNAELARHPQGVRKAVVLYSMGNVAASKALLQHPDVEVVISIAPAFRLPPYFHWPLRIVLFLYEYFLLFLFWLRWLPLPTFQAPCYSAGPDAPTFRYIPLIVAARLLQLQDQTRQLWTEEGAKWRKQFRGQAVVIQGESDRIVDIGSSREFASDLGPRCRYESLADVGHDVMGEAGPHVVPELLRMLTRAPRRAPVEA
ncbi:Alpha/beta hydrolase family protein [Maioricimonas rarisocia]|uniref:Alpha/beta hydrolase family protein n=1 Tax=Maioricimonas rarisocia TaxID=2528026 RepID=A0A517ZAT9_9PLAN|nr:alpha/beta hydrolase [Maioricimonas rarisocia]QDU39567.1 Alpha/beta hydrolase family protein [Maioricimonas rarisocia]